MNHKTTHVSPLITRQIPSLSKLKRITHFKGRVTFDYLSICTSNIDLKYLDDNYISYKSFKSKFYKNCSTYIERSTNQYAFTICWEKTKCNNSSFLHQIQIVPSRYSESTEWIYVLLNLIGKFTENNHKITRLDISFLSKYLKPNLVFLCTHLKWKQLMSKYQTIEINRGEMTGIFSPGKRTSFSCYDVNSKHKSINSVNKEKLTKNKCNMEIQLKNEALQRLGITNLLELKNISLLKKVFFLEFYDLTLINGQIHDEEKIEKFCAFQNCALFNGLTPARYIFNKNKNFHRDYQSKCFVPLYINNGKIKFSDELKFKLDCYIFKVSKNIHKLNNTFSRGDYSEEVEYL